MKKVILTGSSSGFGLLTVKTLAAKGYSVYATMRNVNGSNATVAGEIRQWAAANKAAVQVVELDVTSDASVKKAVEEIAAHAGGHIDALINNAGISFIGVNESLSTAQADQIFQINVLGVDRVIKAVLPYMHQQKNGLIVTVSSVQARQVTPLLSTYNASKAAVDALMVGYYYELKSAGIEVAIVQPGGYPTTDIVSKGLVAANPAVEAHYGANIHAMKAGLIHYFTPTETSPNPQEVADVFLQLLETPQGERPLWSLVGAGPFAETISHINQSTKQLVEGLNAAFGG